MTSEVLAWKIRRHCIEMTHLSHGSHVGAALSAADILAVLYTKVLHYAPKNPRWPLRDRFIMSKGHAGAAVYAALAECGFFDTKELLTHYQNGSRLSGHVSHSLPGVDVSTGSLGHGLSVAVGMAYAAKKDGKPFRTYALLGDGECNEGCVWEAALFASHFRLNNLTAIVDWNRMQSLDFQENTLAYGDFEKKWESFGWNVLVCNGNDVTALETAFGKAQACAEEVPHKPTVILAKTVKGYGIPFMCNDILWHYRFPHDGWEYDCAVTELHKIKPAGAEDPYTPNGIENPALPTPEDDIYNDHTMTGGWHPDYPENLRRVAYPEKGGAV